MDDEQKEESTESAGAESDTASEDTDAPADDAEESEEPAPAVPESPLLVDPIVAAALPVSKPGDLYDKDKATSGVKFHLNIFGPKERVFSEEEHGSSWKDIADEFFKTNAHKVARIEYS